MRIVNLAEGAWIACHDENSGLLIYDGKTFEAIRSIDHWFASLGKGRRGMMGSPRNMDGAIGSEIYLLAALWAKDLTPHFARRCRMAFWLKNGKRENDAAMIDDAEAFDHLAGMWFVALVRRSGNGLQIAAKWLEDVKSKVRPMTDSEDDFLRSVQQAAEDKGGIPTKLEVRNLWLSKDCDRSADSFPDVCDTMGFGWMPAAKQGRPKKRV